MAMVLLLTALLVSLAVLIHFEVLYALSTLMRTRIVHPRVGLLVGVLGALLAHVIEIWIFTFGYWSLLGDSTYGSIEGDQTLSLGDC